MIGLLDLAADLFAHPNEQWPLKYKMLLNEELSISQDRLESIYIEYFSLNSKLYHTTPLASFWLDGKAMGKSSEAIASFYEKCGFAFSGFGMCDHLSTLLAFCALLEEENKKNEFKEFKKYLSWLLLFSEKLELYEDLKPFYRVLKKTILYLDIRKDHA